MTTNELLAVVVAACLGYLLLSNLVHLSFALVGAVENGIRRRESVSEDYATLARSRFTIPVSVIVAAFDERNVIETTIASLLAFDYPEHEVIIVNDGSTDGTLEVLRDRFELEPYEIFVRHVFPSAAVRTVYRSRTHANLVVVDKENGGKADSWNAGLNVARYRYVCGVDADTVFERDTLLKVMRLVVQDPARIIGVTSYVTTASDPARAIAEPPGRRPMEWKPLMAYQHMDFLRAFFNNRLAWSKHGFMLCSPGGFQIWRRDVLEEVGGYSTVFTCEDIELTFRVHEQFLREKRDYRIHCLPHNVGITEGPDDVRKLVSQRERWQRVINETVWAYRRMWFNPRYKAVGLIGAPFYLITETLSPIVEVLAIVSVPVALALGVFDPAAFFLMLGAVAFVNAALTACAILFDDLQSRMYRRRDLALLLVLAPLDLVLYRPIIIWARLKGSWRYLRGDKAWHKFERNVRATA